MKHSRAPAGSLPRKRSDPLALSSAQSSGVIAARAESRAASTCARGEAPRPPLPPAGRGGRGPHLLAVPAQHPLQPARPAEVQQGQHAHAERQQARAAPQQGLDDHLALLGPQPGALLGIPGQQLGLGRSQEVEGLGAVQGALVLLAQPEVAGGPVREAGEQLGVQLERPAVGVQGGLRGNGVPPPLHLAPQAHGGLAS